MTSSRCQTPPAASPDDVRLEPGRRHWLGRTFRQSHPSLSPLTFPPSRDPSWRFPSHSQAETVGSSGQAGLASPLSRAPTWEEGPGTSWGPLCQGPGSWCRGSPLGASSASVFPRAPGALRWAQPQIPPPLPALQAHRPWQGPCLPSWPLVPPHPCWQGQGPQGDWLCGLGPIKVWGFDF